MALTVTCDECSKSYRVPDNAVGKRIKCKGCGNLLKIEAPLDDLEDYEEDEESESDSADGDDDLFDFRKRTPKRQSTGGPRKKSTKRKSKKSSPVSLGKSYVPLGISFVYFGFLGFVFLIIVTFVLRMMLRSAPQLVFAVMPIIAVLITIANIVTTVGKVLCLTAPSKMSGKAFIYVAATIDVAALFIGIARYFMYLPPELINSVNLIAVIAMVCFVLFVKQLGHFMRDSEVVDRALGVLYLGISTVVLWFFILLFGVIGMGGGGARANIAPNLAVALVILLLGLSLLVVGILGVMRYALLLSACRNALEVYE